MIALAIYVIVAVGGYALVLIDVRRTLVSAEVLTDKLRQDGP